MTKNEVIEKAYGEYWDLVKDFVDKDGWIKAKELDWNFMPARSCEIDGNGNWRASSLCVIEKNNGCVSILPDKKLPNIDIWIVDSKGEIHYSPADEFIPINHTFTHYQPIEKPKPPLY